MPRKTACLGGFTPDGPPSAISLAVGALAFRPNFDMLRNMNATPSSRDEPAKARRIELNVASLSQLFNTMDPSPYLEKDLDHDAEEFIVGWAREFPVREPVELVVHLGESPSGQDAQALVAGAVHHYFEYRARLSRLDFRRLMREGWQSLLIGVVFLGGCLAAGQALAGQESSRILSVVRESLVIAGWVAMWRPMEIYLYEWWPLRRRGRVFEKLSTMRVTVSRVPATNGEPSGLH
jgi:hypothetical protein